jgi:DNA-binding response OmpR family regulator
MPEILPPSGCERVCHVFIEKPRASFYNSAFPMRIFLVENHPDTLTYVRRFLERAGHEVDTAQSMEEALRDLPTKPREALLADLGLPDGDGWLLLERLGAARPPLAIAMSGRCSAADLARSKAAGYQEHLVKPFLPGDLERALGTSGSGD